MYSLFSMRLARRGIERCESFTGAEESLDAHASGSMQRGLNRWIDRARELWERFGIVGGFTRGVNFLSELVVGMCLEESHAENHCAWCARHR